MSRANQQMGEKVMEMKTGMPCEQEHDFALVLDGITDLTTQMEDALYEAGCDDATICVRAGRVFLTFSRSAPTMKEAILSAIRNVQEANIGAAGPPRGQLQPGDPGRDCSQYRPKPPARLSIHRRRPRPGAFPAPACNVTGGAPLWYWCEVAHWLWQNDMIKEDVARAARDTAAINSALVLDYYRGMEPGVVDEAIRLLKDISSAPA